MNLRESDISKSKIVYSLMILTLAIGGLIYMAKPDPATAAGGKNGESSSAAVPAATFNADAASLGGIPDGAAGCAPSPGAPRNVTFTAAGLSGSVASVDVSMTFGAPSHTFVGDIVAVLIAPNGASHNIFGRTLATTATAFGDSSDLTGPYVFSDIAAAPPSGGWWQEANIQGAAVAMTPGSYRTTASGGAGATVPMPPTTMNTAFTGVANANGTWTLRFTDGCAGDTGNVSAAALTLTTSAVVPPDANADFNGDGKTDFIVARATNAPFSDGVAEGNGERLPDLIDNQEVKGRRHHAIADPNAIPLAPQIYWYSSINGSGTTSTQPWGDAATDFILTEDFDGDGKDDLAVWREAPATQAAFYILQSATNTFKLQVFGQTGDDPAVVGDYDGDGKADPAVYRCPGIAAPAGQCFFFYRGSLNNAGGNVTFVPWGFGNDGDNFPYVGDFDGDGKNDFCIQRSNTAIAGQGQFALSKSGGGTEFINWGLDTDFLIPGDYDGDGKTDFCVRRTISGSRVNYILSRTGATSQIPWGITNDVSVPGDYDGDGKTDLAIWRGSATPGASTFWVRNSSNNSVTQFAWGSCPVGNCDFAVAAWSVH